MASEMIMNRVKIKSTCQGDNKFMSEGGLCLIVSMSESQKGMYRIEVMFRRQDKGYVRAEVELEESEMEVKRQME